MSTTVIAEPLLDEEAQPRRGRRKLVLLLLLVVLAAGAAAAWFFLFADGAEAVDPAEVDGEIVALEPMTTTVGEDALHHARVAVAIVLTEGQDPTIVEPRVALLQDALLRELSRMDGEQVRSAEGSDALRTRLTADAKDIWGEEVVRRVVLTELLVS